MTNTYFQIFTPGDIRVKGTRVGIETILYDFIYRGRAPENIAADYPSLTLEQVYATITYYLHNIDQVTAYMVNWLETAKRRREEQNRNPSAGILRLRRIAAEREAAVA